MNDFLTAYKRYALFEGRSGRKEFWYFVLFYVVVGGLLSILDGMTLAHVMGGVSPLSSIFGLVSLVPSIAIAIRRLHDTNRSGWLVLVGLIPVVGWIFLVIWYCQKSDEAANRFGDATLPATVEAVQA